jgi:hypothetical protein
MKSNGFFNPPNENIGSLPQSRETIPLSFKNSGMMQLQNQTKHLKYASS